jgi:hypothetical protein
MFTGSQGFQPGPQNNSKTCPEVQQNRKCEGPASKTKTSCDDRYIRLTHLRDGGRTASATARHTLGMHGRPMSEQTVRNRLRDGGLRARSPYVGLVLSARRRQLRLAWARRHLRFTRADWGRVLFTDESRFNLRRSDGRSRVYRRTGERYSDVCVRERGQYGGGSVMVWAGISPKWFPSTKI